MSQNSNNPEPLLELTIAGQLVFKQGAYISIPCRIVGSNGRARRSQYDIRFIGGRPRNAYTEEVLTVRPCTPAETSIFGEPAYQMYRCVMRDGKLRPKAAGMVSKAVWREIVKRFGK